MSSGQVVEGSMTDSRWELIFVTLVAATLFFAAWRFVAPLIGYVLLG
jgi:hypothetical protein